MEEQSPQSTSANCTDERYQQLYLTLYEYHLGGISFLELVERFEQTLHIRPPCICDLREPDIRSN